MTNPVLFFREGYPVIVAIVKGISAKVRGEKNPAATTASPPESIKPDHIDTVTSSAQSSA